MPTLNTLGQSACGVGNIALSIDGATPAALGAITGGGATWLTNTLMSFQDSTGAPVLKTYDTGSHAVAALGNVVAGGANILHAGGGVACAWRAGFGAYTNVTAFGPPYGGSAAVVNGGASGGVDELGNTVIITNTQAGQDLAVYSSAGTLRAAITVQLGLQQPIPVRGGYFAYANAALGWVIRNVAGTVIPYLPRTGVNWTIPLPLADGTIALIERTETLSIRLKDSSVGYILSAPTAQGFNPDAIELSPGVIRVCWSTNAGESRTALQVQDIALATGANQLATVVGTSLAWVTQSPLTPVELTSGQPTLTKWVGWYYSSGRYGDYRPTQNCTILALANYKDSGGTLPPGAASQMLAAAIAAGGIFCSGDQEDLDVMRNNWGLVAGLVIGELGTQAEMANLAGQIRARVNANGLPQRQIIATLQPTQILSGSWTTAPSNIDAYAVEIYFDGPGAGSYAAQYAATATRITQVLAAAGAVPIYLIAQAYDRNGTWTDMDQVGAIIDACGDAMKVG